MSNILDDQAYSEPYYSQSSFSKHFQEFLVIFRDTDVYSATLTSVQLGGINYVHLWFKIFIENIVLKVSGRNTPTCFPVWRFFLHF